MTDRLVLEAELEEIRERVTELEDGEAGQLEPDELETLRKREAEIVGLLAAVDVALDPPPEVVNATDVDGTAPDPMDFAPAGADLVVVEPHETFAVLDRHDERAVMEELARRGTKRLFYDFDNKVDLSIHGVLEAVGLMNRTGKVQIAVDPSSAVIEEVKLDGKPHIKARVYARDAVTGFGVFGTSTQEVYMKKRNGDEIFDKFAETKALNKAQRNALGMLIPQPIRQAMIAQATGNTDLMREVQHGVGAAAVAELPPPDTSPEAEALRAEIQQAYDELREMNAMAMPPGVYHATLANVSHSAVELRGMLGWLRAKIEEQKAVTS